MELRHFRYFVAIADQMNFRKAATRLRISQTALTTQLKDLEAEIGVQLLLRDTRGVRGLTPAGQVFLDECRSILKRTDSAVRLAKSAAKPGAGHLTIGSIGALASFLSPHLQRLQTEHPQVEVSLAALGMVEHTDALEAREIDVGFTLGARDPFPPTIQSKPLLRTPLLVVVATHHRLARRQSIALSALTPETFLTLNYRGRSSLHLKQAAQIFTNHRLILEKSRPVDDFESMLAILGSGTGYTLLPEISVRALPSSLVVRPVAGSPPDLSAELSVLWRVNETSPLVHKFISILTSASRKP